MRPIQWHLKQHWRVPESLEKEIPVPRSLHPHLLWWTKETSVLTRQPLHPLSLAVQIFTDASKEGWGAHLGDFTARGISRKSSSHKLSGTKSCLTSLEKIPALSTRKSSSSCHRQHHGCGIHQQGRRYEVRLSLCPSMATPVLV